MGQTDWWLKPLAEYKPEEDIVTPVSAVLVAALKNLNYHIESPSKVYPTLDSGVAITADSTPWDLGDFTDIIPADTIKKDFTITGVTIEDVSAVGIYELVLYKGDHTADEEEEIGRVRLARQANIETDKILITTPNLEADERVSAKLASDAGAESVTVALNYIEVGE